MRCIRQVAMLALAMACLVSLSLTASAGLPNVKDKLKKKAAEEAAKKVPQVDQAAPEASGEEGAGESAEAGGEPGEGVWVNYDFIPGSRQIFFDDFSRDAVGNFPQRLELLEGNMEVAEYQGRRWVRATTGAVFNVPLGDPLPDRFTVEFDLLTPTRWNRLYVQGAIPDDYSADNQPTQVSFDPWDLRSGLIYAGPKEGSALTEVPESVFTKLMHCRIMGDGKYLKVYVNETRVANFPNTDFIHSNALEFRVQADTEYPLMISDIRVAVSDKTMYDALASDGRVVTYGILFDSGSDKIRPESTPTLKEIGQMLKDHADLRLRIEGHTDSVGDDASNQALSEKRAAAVRAFLISEYGVTENRLEAQGFGETKPVGSNDTPEGRQSNRRVELVKI